MRSTPIGPRPNNGYMDPSAVRWMAAGGWLRHEEAPLAALAHERQIGMSNSIVSPDFRIPNSSEMEPEPAPKKKLKHSALDLATEEIGDEMITDMAIEHVAQDVLMISPDPFTALSAAFKLADMVAPEPKSRRIERGVDETGKERVIGITM